MDYYGICINRSVSLEVRRQKCQTCAVCCLSLADSNAEHCCLTDCYLCPNLQSPREVMRKNLKKAWSENLQFTILYLIKEFEIVYTYLHKINPEATVDEFPVKFAEVHKKSWTCK